MGDFSLFERDLLMMSDICRKCGRVLCVCLPLVGPVMEVANSPPEQCRLSAPCSFGDSWVPHGEEHDSPTKPAIERRPAVGPTGPTGTAAGATAFTGTGTLAPVTLSRVRFLDRRSLQTEAGRGAFSQDGAAAG